MPRAQQSELPEAQEEGYGTVELDNAAAGAETARKIRYVQKFQTEGGTKNIDYTANGPAGNETNYVDATSQELEVAQGATVKVKIKAMRQLRSRTRAMTTSAIVWVRLGWISMATSSSTQRISLRILTRGECVVFFWSGCARAFLHRYSS